MALADYPPNGGGRSSRLRANLDHDEQPHGRPNWPCQRGRLFETQLTLPGEHGKEGLGGDFRTSV